MNGEEGLGVQALIPHECQVSLVGLIQLDQVCMVQLGQVRVSHIVSVFQPLQGG